MLEVKADTLQREWHLLGERKALNFLRKIRDSGEFELWTGALQGAEVVFFMRADEEEATELFLSQFKTAPIGGIRVIEDTKGVTEEGGDAI